MKSEKQLYQWDVNQYLTELQPSAQFVDYPMGNEVIRIETEGKRCRIPDEFLQTAGFKTCYERYSDGTYKAYSFNVQSSPKPPDYVYTAEERTTFEALVEKTDAAIDEIKRRADSGEFTPVKGVDYFTEKEKTELMEGVSSGAVGEFRKVVDTATTEYNDNHNLKLAKYNANASEKLTTYDVNAEQRTSDYNRNAEQKLEAYNQNHTEKVEEYNQNAAALQTEVDRLRGECDNLAAENRKQENRISALMKLNKGQTYDILPEEGETVSRTAPSGAKYVSVDKVGGKSIVWTQLWNYGETLKEDGITFTYENYFYDVVQNTTKHNGLLVYYNVKPGNKYYLSFEASSSDNISLTISLGAALIAELTENNKRYSTIITTYTSMPVPRSAIYLYSPDEVTCSYRVGNIKVIDLTAMFGVGNEPTAEQFEAMFPAESYPYNPGEIISGTTASIDLIPGNIYPGTQSVKYYPCKIAKGETFTASATCGQSDVKCRFASEDGSQKDYFSLSTGVGGGRYKRVISAQFDIAIVMFDVATGKEASGFVVEMGEGDGTYKKYFEPSQLPTSFPELRSARAAHDYIELDGGEIRRNVGAVDLETLNWTYSDKYRWIISRDLIGIIATPATSIDIPNVISNKFDIVEQKNNTTLPGLCVWSNGPITIKSENITSAADLSGAVLQYELATPTTEPVTIPEALTEWLPVEPGGTVTFRNADESKQLPVPNAVSWVRKLNEVE